jgi:hypothetical protein
VKVVAGEQLASAKAQREERAVFAAVITGRDELDALAGQMRGGTMTSLEAFEEALRITWRLADALRKAGR